MTLSELSIRRPVFAWMIMVALILFGWIAFTRLGVSQLPDVDFPIVSVGLTLQGAAPEVMESQVLDPIEDAIMQIDGIRNLTSTASQSSGSIAVEFDLSQDIDTAVQEVENHIKQVQNLLPTSLLAPTVRKSNPEDQPILWVALTADPSVSIIDMMIYARNTLYNQFATVEGVGDIAMGGYVDPALRVDVDTDKLKYFDLTAADVLGSINSEQIELPAGRIEGPHKEYNLRIRGEATSPEQFGKIRIESRTSGINYRPTKMEEIGAISEGTADVRKMSRMNGERAVALGMLKQHGSNAVDVATGVRAKLEELKNIIPKQYHVTVRSDQTRFIKQSVDELNFTLILSALLTSVVCYLFLGSWTSTLNVLMAIPTSIVGAFIFIYFFGFTLNTFTLLGLSLAIGIVVDDAIMMLENIVRHREMGASKRMAAIRGADEIRFAALAATIAVCAIFLPVIYMKGVIGRYFYQYGVTVTAAVLLSLLEALTLTPMRCSQYLNVHEPKGLAKAVDLVFNKLARIYEVTLRAILRHPLLLLAATLALFVGSIYLAKLLPSEMIPSQDQSMFVLRFKGPVGTSIEVTNDVMHKAEQWIGKQPDVDSNFSMVGGFGGDAVNQGSITVTLVDQNKRKDSQKEIMQRFRKALQPMCKPFQVVGQDLSMRGFSSSRGFPVEFRVEGSDWEKLVEATNALMDKLEDSGVVNDMNIDVQDDMPEYHVVPNRDKLAQHAVSLNNVTSTLNTLFGGALLNGAVEYPKAGHRYEIEVRLKSNQRDREKQLHEVMIPNNMGQVIPLADLVDIKEVPSLMLISRENRARAIRVYGNLVPGHSQQQGLATAEEYAKKYLPPGYTIHMAGSSQDFHEAFRSLIVALLLGILVSYMVLASQFNSFIHPIAVLMALPFSISGAFVGLWLTHNSINIYSMIGLILLMGIVKKNSILLVDFTNQLRAEGHGVHEALVRACPVRLRPIMMTSIATIAGALPEALAIGPGAESTIPMATAIVGGVIASTFLTLFAVPCAYIVLSRFESKTVIDFGEEVLPGRAQNSASHAGAVQESRLASGME